MYVFIAVYMYNVYSVQNFVLRKRMLICLGRWILPFFFESPHTHFSFTLYIIYTCVYMIYYVHRISS